MTVLIAKTRGEAKALSKMLFKSPVVMGFGKHLPDEQGVMPAVFCLKDEDGDVLSLPKLGEKDLYPHEVLEERWEREFATRLVRRLDEGVRDKRKAVEAFAARIAQDPSRLLGNNDSELRAAGSFRVLSQLQAWRDHAIETEGDAFDPLAWYRAVVKEATDRVLREASSFGWSTSPTSSVGSRAELEAWTRIARRDFLMGF